VVIDQRWPEEGPRLWMTQAPGTRSWAC
jgi:hypothetical protein